MIELTETEKCYVVLALRELAIRIGPTIFSDILEITRKLDIEKEFKRYLLVEYLKNANKMEA
jgi:hypothetical protein